MFLWGYPPSERRLQICSDGGRHLGGAGLFDAYVIERDVLLVGRPNGVLDACMIEKIVEFIEIKEEPSETGFNRFCDLTRLESINLSFPEVQLLAKRRSLFNPNDFHVKSAFLATHPLAFGIARMYEELLNSPWIDIRVFREMESAAKWLEVQPDRLTL
jgi:hypothetical protein